MLFPVRSSCNTDAHLLTINTQDGISEKAALESQDKDLATGLLNTNADFVSIPGGIENARHQQIFFVLRKIPSPIETVSDLQGKKDQILCQGPRDKWGEKWDKETSRGYIPQNVLTMAEELGDKAAVGREEIQERLAQFVQHWEELQELAKAR